MASWIRLFICLGANKAESEDIKLLEHVVIFGMKRLQKGLSVSCWVKINPASTKVLFVHRRESWFFLKQTSLRCLVPRYPRNNQGGNRHWPQEPFNLAEWKVCKTLQDTTNYSKPTMKIRTENKGKLDSLKRCCSCSLDWDLKSKYVSGEPGKGKHTLRGETCGNTWRWELLRKPKQFSVAWG